MRTIIELPPGMAPGFRFSPTDEELIEDYLMPKLLGRGSEVDHVIADVDFCKIEPWDLPSESKIESKDRVWFFFCEQRLKFGSRKKSKRRCAETGVWKITGKRKTGTGEWKITGEEGDIMDQDTGECIGKKRTLVFDKSNDENTKWAMQEYYIIPDDPLPNQSIYVLRRVKRKSKPNKKAKGRTPDGGEGEPSGDIRSEVENSVTPAAISSENGREEVNQELLRQPLSSPVCGFTDEEISLMPSLGFLGAHSEMQALRGAGDPKELPQEFLEAPASGDTDAKGADVQEPYAICRLNNKTDEKAGSPGCHGGEPGGDIIYNMKNPVAPTAISDAYGCAEENEDSPLLSPDHYLTEEDLRSIFSDCPGDGQQINLDMNECHPEPQNSVPRKRPYVICRLEKKTGKEDATPGCDEGEPSGSSGNISDIENQAAATAISEEPGHAEVNADLLSQPPLSPGWLFTDDNILFLSDLLDGNQTINCDMEENHPEPGNSVAHQGPNVISHLENKSDKMAGAPSCDEGEPSGAANIVHATEIPVAPAAISEEPGHAEVNADLLSQPPLSPGWRFTDDNILFLSDLLDGNQTINCNMEENHPEPGNSLAHQGPYVTSSLENKTDGMAGIPGCVISKPSSNITFDIENQVAPPVIPEVRVSSGLLSQPLLSSDCYSTVDNSLVLSNSFNDGHNKMQVSSGADEPEESFAEVLDLLVDPYENYSEETANNLYNINIQRKSLKRLDFQDSPASVDTDVEGVNGRVKRSRSLAPGELLPWLLNH